MKCLIDVLDAAVPDLGPLLTAYQTEFQTALAREQDKAGLKGVERFGSLITSLGDGVSTLDIESLVWHHLSLSAMLLVDLIALPIIVEGVPGAAMTIAPYQQGKPALALVTAKAATWRDAIVAGVEDSRASIAGVFAELYRAFCRRGYDAIWRDYRATTEDNRLRLEMK